MCDILTKLKQQIWSLGECELCFSPCGAAGFLCKPCYEALAVAQPCCERCAMPLAVWGLCQNCLLQPPAFEGVFCSFLYRPPVSFWLLALKDRHALNLWPRLLWLMKSRPAPFVQDVDAVVYVPSATKHWLKRGFNPAELFARALAKDYGLPVYAQALHRVGGKDQRQLGRKQRLANSQRSLKAGRENLTGLRLLLVEDVVTTGATAAAAAVALKAQGAAQVWVWALARAA